jgi:hypothetical protein
MACVILGTISLPMPGLQNTGFQFGLVDDQTSHGLGTGLSKVRMLPPKQLADAAVPSLQRETVKPLVR